MDQKDKNKALERVEKLKMRLNFDGYNLYSCLLYLIKTEKGRKELDEIQEKYGKALKEYVDSVSSGGREILQSKPPVISGPRKSIEKLLTIILYMMEDFQGKRFGVEDLKIIKSRKEEESEEFTFIDYPFISVVDLHKNIINRDNMMNWRMEGILETVSTRRLDRMPMILISECPVGCWFSDDSMFTYINLFSASQMAEFERKRKEEAQKKEEVNNSKKEETSTDANRYENQVKRTAPVMY